MLSFFSSLCTMFENLQKKWKVSPSQLFLILCTFAVTGTLTAYISRSITSWIGFDENTLLLWKILLRLTVLIFGYQVIILIVAFFFGQFPFFWNYEKKILHRMGLIKELHETNHNGQVTRNNNKSNSKQVYNIAIFASGAGSNAKKIIEHFENQSDIHISLIVCNKPGAGVIQIASNAGIPVLMIERKAFLESGQYVQEIKNQGITHIVLAGFLWKIPVNLIAAFPNRIVNIHPALLPNYGGKGMYGSHVHEAVIAAGEHVSGITIHLVDEQYDHGKTLFQAEVAIAADDTPDSLASKIHVLEHAHYPRVIEDWILGSRL